MVSTIDYLHAYLTAMVEKQIIFVTNNATKSRKNYKGKFDKLGIEAYVVSTAPWPLDCVYHSDVAKDEIYGSAYAAAVYISSVVKLPKDKKVYVIGMSGMEEELANEGIQYLGGTVSLVRAYRMSYQIIVFLQYRIQQTTPSLQSLTHPSMIPMSAQSSVALTPASTTPSSLRHSSTLIETLSASSLRQMRIAHTLVIWAYFLVRVLSALRSGSPWVGIRLAVENPRVRCWIVLKQSKLPAQKLPSC